MSPAQQGNVPETSGIVHATVIISFVIVARTVTYNYS